MINTSFYADGVNQIYGTTNSMLNRINRRDDYSSNNLFKSAFENAANALREVDDLQNASNDATVKFITGEDDNIHNVLLAQEKALIALQFTSEVTNKALEAYNEIMKMQI